MAYSLLSKFFFKPVLNAIEKQVDSEKKLHKSIGHYRGLLTEASLKKQQLWLESCSKFHVYNDFVDQIDLQSKACDFQLLSEFAEIEIDSKEQDQLTQILIDKIITMQ